MTLGYEVTNDNNASDKKPDLYEKCPNCRYTLRKKNIKRHLEKMHGMEIKRY